jgi:hypothetical protein
LLSVGELATTKGEKIFRFFSVTYFTLKENYLEFLIHFQKHSCYTKYNAIIGAGASPLSVIVVPS